MKLFCATLVSLALANGPSMLAVKTEQHAMVADMLSNKVSFGQLMEHAREHQRSMKIEDVNLEKMEVPASVKALLKKSSKKAGKQDPGFSEESLAKARRILNGMMEKAQVELDAKTIECKEFHERNRNTFNQITTDLSRLGAQITNLDRLKSDAVSSIAGVMQQMQDLDEEKEKEVFAYFDVRSANEIDMEGKKNDLAVMDFIMKLTECKDGAALVQTEVLSCTEGNTESYRFRDAKMQEEVSKMKSVEGVEGVQLAIMKSVIPDIDLSAFVSALQTRSLSSAKQPASTEAEIPSKCVLGKPNCGLLHDNMSLEWGKMKDKVDALQDEMDHNEAEFNKLMDDMNAQKTTLVASKASLDTQLAEATAQRNADSDEQLQKQGEMRDVEAQFAEVWGECMEKIHELLFTGICAVKTVRGEVAKHSKDVPPEKILDCEVGDFIAGPCSKPCDDDLVGGVQDLKREVISINNEFGMVCPKLVFEKKCGQFPCKVDCKVTPWSDFSKCTKECGGGVQGRTRNIITKPKHGGESCPDTLESRACNTGSCDRNCLLNKWSEKTPCSQACDGGYYERFRSIKRPVRANGKCPRKDSRLRYEKHQCNEHKCSGDEICEAHQDLLILVDSSGSILEKGHKIMQSYLKQYVKNLRAKNRIGGDGMNVGLIQFGQGKILEDGSIAKAEIVHPLSPVDNAALDAAIDKMTWQRGFSNFAQAFSAANVAFLNGGRKRAHSMMLIVTDGKPSFHFQTEQAIKKLKGSGVQVVVNQISLTEGQDAVVMKEMATQPAATNFIHVPGFKKLKADPAGFAHKTLVHTCGAAYSPSQREIKVERRGWDVVSIRVCDKADQELLETNGKGEKMSFRDCITAVVNKNAGSEFAYSRWKKQCYTQKEGCEKKKTKPKMYSFKLVGGEEQAKTSGF